MHYGALRTLAVYFVSCWDTEFAATLSHRRGHFVDEMSVDVQEHRSVLFLLDYVVSEDFVIERRARCHGRRHPGIALGLWWYEGSN
jgi:hypothetical protein